MCRALKLRIIIILPTDRPEITLPTVRITKGCLCIRTFAKSPFYTDFTSKKGNHEVLASSLLAQEW